MIFIVKDEHNETRDKVRMIFRARDVPDNIFLS